MKKTIFFAMMAAVLGFTACSKAELAQLETDQKGMVLHATVAQAEDTKATFTDNEGVWHFDYAEGDQITVYNKVGDNTSSDYTFTNNGTDFISTDAEPTSEPARWYAFYPSKEVSLVGQTGKWEDLANMYALVGSTPYGSNVTGKDGLDITMEPKCAILKIINQKGSIDINVKNKSNGYWIKGLSASGSSFVPSHDEAKQTLLSTTEVGTYYIAVPAGIAFTVYNGDGDDNVIRSTSKGLTAGKYYELVVEDYFKITANKDPNHTENYYATFYSSKSAYEVPQGVRAYTAVVGATKEDVLCLTDIGNIIHKGEPVILKASCSRFTLMPSDNKDAAFIENMLLGTDEETTLGANDYTLSLGQSGVGFYLWRDKSLGANKAYLRLNNPTMAKEFTFSFDD